jgi:saccharopine dehydrogenase (NADP+, L-glutamate forming)
MKTLRYQGFPEFVNVLVDIGFLSDEEQNFLKEPITWKEATKKMLDAASTSEDDLLKAISSKTSFRDHDEKERLISGLKWRESFCSHKSALLTRPYSWYLFRLKDYAKRKPLRHALRPS